MTRNRTLGILVALQIIYVLFVLAWLFIAAMSVMLFDSPDASGSVVTWLVFGAIVLYPAGLLAGLIGSWIMFARRRYRAALWWNALPLAWIVPLGGFLVYANVG